MIYFCRDREEVAQFVSDLLLNLGINLISITITNRELFGDYSVHIVTDGSSEDTVEKWVQNYYGLRMSTSTENTPDG